MDKIQDYVRWRGDLGYAVQPFSTEDIVVLCSLMYCPWEDLQERSYRGQSLGELNAWIYRDGELPRNAAGWQKKLHKMWKILPEYTRFADIRLADFMATTDDADEDQIAVATFELDDADRTVAVVAYRGTDTTISDWKESLEIAHHGLLPARQIALDYLNSALDRYEHVYVCGHSKGGTLALYSAVHADRQERIESVFNLDGPGIDRASYEVAGWEKIKERTTTIVPAGSVFGVMMGYAPNYSVVSSGAVGFNQHDTFTWDFDGPHLRYVDKLSEKSSRIAGSFRDFMEESDEEERRLLIDTVQNLVDQAETDDVNALAVNAIKRAPQIIKHIRNIDKNDKAALREITKKLIRQR